MPTNTLCDTPSAAAILQQLWQSPSDPVVLPFLCRASFLPAPSDAGKSQIFQRERYARLSSCLQPPLRTAPQSFAAPAAKKDEIRVLPERVPGPHIPKAECLSRRKQKNAPTKWWGR